MNYQKFYTNQIHSSSLLCQLAQMWKTQVLCDAMIKTGSVTTKAHRVVLVAACPMLQSMDNATSGSHLEVRLAAEIKQDSINTFLQYLYEGFMMLTEENVRDVEKIARLLQVDSIIKCCADFHKCLQSKTGAPSPQYKYGFHDMIEFRHVRSSDLQKTVHERMMKRPSEMSRPGSPGNKRHRSNRPSSPSSDASGSGDISHSTPAPWDRVPQLGSGMSSQSSSWPSQVGRSQPEPGVIEIIEDSLELVQTVGPDKDSGPGGTRLDPRAVQKSVAISVASQMNTETDLRVVDVPSDHSDTRTTYQTSTAPSAQVQGPGSSHSRSFTHSSSSSKESKFSDKSYSGMSSREESKKQRPDIPLQSFSSDNLHARAIQQHRASNESHSTPQKMPLFPVSISPIGSGKSFAAGSAEQVSSASDLPSARSPAYRPQASPASHHSPMTPPSMSPSSVKSQSISSMRRPSDMGRPDIMDDSSSEKGQDHRKDSNMPQSSTADMTPDLSIVKVETKQGTSYSANTETGGLDMYVDMPEHEQPDDDEGNIDYEEPSGDWSHEDDGSNISGDQSSAWYSGSYQDKCKKEYRYPETVEDVGDGYSQPLVAMDTSTSLSRQRHHGSSLSSDEFENSNISYVGNENTVGESSEISQSHKARTASPYWGDSQHGIRGQSSNQFGMKGQSSDLFGMEGQNCDGFECDICKKTFAHKGSLKIHMRLHTGECPYRCEICGKAYPQKIQLTLHMHHHQ